MIPGKKNSAEPAIRDEVRGHLSSLSETLRRSIRAEAVARPDFLRAV